jgi:hypothetical protein
LYYHIRRARNGPGRRREAGEKRARAGLEVVSKDRRRTEGPSPEIGGASSGCV